MADKKALSYKARRRWALVILLIGMPLYIVLAVNVISWLDRPSLLVELVVYVLLGVVCGSCRSNSSFAVSARRIRMIPTRIRAEARNRARGEGRCPS